MGDKNYNLLVPKRFNFIENLESFEAIITGGTIAKAQELKVMCEKLGIKVKAIDIVGEDVVKILIKNKENESFINFINMSDNMDITDSLLAVSNIRHTYMNQAPIIVITETKDEAIELLKSDIIVYLYGLDNTDRGIQLLKEKIIRSLNYNSMFRTLDLNIINHKAKDKTLSKKSKDSILKKLGRLFRLKKKK